MENYQRLDPEPLSRLSRQYRPSQTECTTGLLYNVYDLIQSASQAWRLGKHYVGIDLIHFLLVSLD